MARVGPGGAVYQPQAAPWSARTYVPGASPNNPGPATWDGGPQPTNSGPRTGTATTTAPRPTTAPTTAPPGPWTPSNKPGYGETWWNQTQDQWKQPTQGANYWSGIQGYFAPGPNTTETNIGGYGQQLGDTTGPMESLYNQYAGAGAFTNPGDMEKWFAQNGGNITAPNGGTTALGDAISGYGNATDMEKWFAQNGGQYSKPGDATTYYNGTINTLLNNNNLGDHASGIAGDINGARTTAGFFGATAGDLARPGYAESLADMFNPNQQTYNEQFLTGGGATEGLNQLYDRLYSQGARKLDERAAAGGSFNSGASLRAQEELGADLNAQHVRDYMAAANAADQSRNAYEQYGLGLTTAADSGLRGRISTGLTGANMVDTTALNRAKAAQDLYTGVSDETRGNITAGGVLANNSSVDALNRLNAYRDAANDSSTQSLNRLNGMTTAGNFLAGDILNQYKAAADAANNSQLAGDRRINTGITAAHNAQDDWMTRLLNAGNLGSMAENLQQNRYRTGSDIATSVDTGNTTRWTAGQNAANSAENEQINRENSEFNNLNTLGNEQAGATSSAMDTIRREQASQLADQINGMLRSGQITADQVMAKYGAQMQALGLIMQGGQIIASGGTSLAVPKSGATGGGPTSTNYSRGSATGAAGDNTLPVFF